MAYKILSWDNMLPMPFPHAQLSRRLRQNVDAGSSTEMLEMISHASLGTLEGINQSLCDGKENEVAVCAVAEARALSCISSSIRASGFVSRVRDSSRVKDINGRGSYKTFYYRVTYARDADYAGDALRVGNVLASPGLFFCTYNKKQLVDPCDCGDVKIQWRIELLEGRALGGIGAFEKGDVLVEPGSHFEVTDVCISPDCVLASIKQVRVPWSSLLVPVGIYPTKLPTMLEAIAPELESLVCCSCGKTSYEGALKAYKIYPKHAPSLLVLRSYLAAAGQQSQTPQEEDHFDGDCSDGEDDLTLDTVTQSFSTLTPSEMELGRRFFEALQKTIKDGKDVKYDVHVHAPALTAEDIYLAGVWADHVQRNTSLALSLWQKAADEERWAGDSSASSGSSASASAINTLGWCEIRGVARNNNIYAAFGPGYANKVAYEMFCRAAKLGHAFGIYNKGFCMMRGWGTDLDVEGGEKLLAIAAERGHAASMCALASQRRRDKDYFRSFAGYCQASKAGSAAATYYKALSYETGRGVGRDEFLAYIEYKLAAERGQSNAMNNLGVLLHNGIDDKVAPNQFESCRMYALAARAGNSFGAYNLGVILTKGPEHYRNTDLGKRLLRIAADKGHEEAKKSLLLLSIPTSSSSC